MDHPSLAADTRDRGECCDLLPLDGERIQNPPWRLSYFDCGKPEFVCCIHIQHLWSCLSEQQQLTLSRTAVARDCPGEHGLAEFMLEPPIERPNVMKPSPPIPLGPAEENYMVADLPAHLARTL